MNPFQTRIGSMLFGERGSVPIEAFRQRSPFHQTINSQWMSRFAGLIRGGILIHIRIECFFRLSMGLNFPGV